MPVGYRGILGIMGIGMVWATLGRLPSARAQDTAPAGVRLVYHTDFSGPVGDEWSEKTTAEVPKDKRKFLGRFVEEPVELSLKNLPPHELLRVTLDVIFMGNWDGSSQRLGPDIWDCRVVGGATLVHSSFCNAGFRRDSLRQSFPDVFPSMSYPAWTGAAEHQTLGFMQTVPDTDRSVSMDSVYHLTLTFPQRDPAVRLRFSAIMKGEKDRGWGLSNVQVETLDTLVKHDDKTLADLWQQLADRDPEVAFAATWALSASGAQIVGYLQQHLLEGMNEQTIARLIAQLDDNDFAVREQANRTLEQHRALALPLLRHTLETTPSGEVAGRIEAIINSSLDGASTEALRLRRVDHLLQVIGTPAALQLRAKLAVPAPAPVPEKPAE